MKHARQMEAVIHLLMVFVFVLSMGAPFNSFAVQAAPDAPDAAWTAFNDCVWASGQPNTNITTYSYTGTTSGLLRNYATGANTTVTVAITYNGNINSSTTNGANSASGTDAYNTFAGPTSMTGVINYTATAGWWVDVTLTGLDPAKTYTFATSANRADSSYTRDSRFTISDMTAATNASTSGVNVISNESVYFNTGYNTVNGYVARWTGIQPGTDGDFKVRVEANSGYYGYGPSVFMLQEESAQTTVTFQEGVGNYTGTVDTHIRQTAASTSHGNATSVEWDTEETAGNANTQKFALIRFDNIFGSGAYQIPPGASIQSATLRYVVSNIGNAANVNDVTVDWTEAETWNSFGGDAGVQTDEYAASVGSASGAATGAQTVDVTASLAAWASNPSANRGWIFRPTGTDGVDIRSSEYSTSADRPSLTVVYSLATTPRITTSGTLNAFSSTPGNPSAEQNYAVSGSNLTGDITITPPADFELSLTSGSGFGAAPLTLTPSGGSVPSTTVYVRFNRATEGTSSGNITHTSPGATAQNVAVSGTATAPLTSWTAYNDCIYRSSDQYIAANVTQFGVGSGFTGATSGLLLDQATGRSTGVTAALTQSGGVNWQPDPATGGNDTAAGTDAYTTFHNIADMTGVIYYGSTGWYVDLTFTGLDPAKTYTFATSSNRAGGTTYANRISRYTISGVDAATNASTSGVTVKTTTFTNDTSAFSSGENTATGYVARWTGIQPGADGSFAVRAQADTTVNQAYAFDVFLLQMESVTVQHTLTVSDDGNGSVTLNPSGGVYNEGSTVILTPVPDSGYLFSSWSGANAGDLVDNGNGTWSIVMNTDKAVTANFAVAPTTVTFQEGVNGYTGTLDTHIMENEPATDHGALDYVNWDTDDPAGTGQYKYALLRFDNIFGSNPGQIPLGASIQSATLRYTVFNTGDPADTNQVAVAWSEAETWNSFGGDAGVQADEYGASAGSASGAAMGAQSLDVTASLSAWASNPSANLGWIFRPTGTDGVDFRSSEYTTAAQRPSLTVVYLPGTPTCRALTLGHTGQGADPVASPANSAGCPAGQYLPGEAISLSGAMPETGWQIGSWYGTGNNPSTASTNSLNMPAIAHSAGVNYIAFTPTGRVCESFDTGWSDGARIDNANWFSNNAGPTIEQNEGVASSWGLGNSGTMFIWRTQAFHWSDPYFTGVVAQLDFETSATAQFDDDRVGWQTTNSDTNSDYAFGVQMDNSGGHLRIEGYWDHVYGSSDDDGRPEIVSLDSAGLLPNAWYRLIAEFTRLTATSARIDVELWSLDASGNPLSLVASGTLADTSALGSTSPNASPAPEYFTAANLYPVYKNHIDQPAFADNACHEPIFNEGPNMPTLAYPADGAVDVPVPATLSVDVTDPDGDAMTVRFYGRDMSAPFALVGEVNLPAGAGGGRRPQAPTAPVSVQWPGLAYLTQHEWYVTINDGLHTTTGPTLDFTTEDNPTAVTMASFDATPGPGNILLAWETVMETDLVGFNVYRSATLEGERQRLNAALIPGQAPGSMSGASYEFSVPVAPGQNYFYWLEAIMTGETTWFGPVAATGNWQVYLPAVAR